MVFDSSCQAGANGGFVFIGVIGTENKKLNDMVGKGK
ncbi:hypothetical protein C8D91_2935 [Marinicella litoralis]|uniref:Uncharacterized protein n=1 Tax=Marinicella litoralis TaxID=644220 RepID=A0A4R6XAY0_9GAMM|nr:hypothetical protein C8D91_2935 [Marinicella litoralis]